MTTVPSGEARATSTPTHGDSKSTDIPTVGSQSPVPLLADVPAALSTAALAEQQDVDQASIKPATLEDKSGSGDKDKHEAAAGHGQEPKEATTLLDHPAPDALQTSMGLQDSVQNGPGQDSRMTQGPQVFQQDSLIKEETPQTAGAPGRGQELAPSTPSAQVQSPQNVEAQPVLSTADANSQPDTRASDTAEAVEKPEDLEALNPDTYALPSAPTLPGPRRVALGRRPTDYEASENNYMRSMTSLLGGGEGSFSSLADILVWSETTMSMATGILASGRGSMTDLLHTTGPGLHSVSSILGSASSAFSSGLAEGTISALRTVTHILESVERRTMEGIRSAVRYLTSHLTPSQAQASPNLN
ncbi:Testis-expressed protein 44 [Camelus dromedarius]|uniref:Testis-expressed protein 44 n=1 Tax=Camelus dromedarius TaxID=9838 RepID=A0A5N4E6Z8_CAMDR|nr:testis-expressed protein 44 [Camelus dromedarius]KAB1278806.1 Testis-expressed protein 44 [Camelus dromedarius]